MYQRVNKKGYWIYKRFLTLSFLVFFSAFALAEQKSSVNSASEYEPEVRITHRGSAVIEEYRVNNRLYMIKVNPKKGVPYYLVDTDGDGDFDSRQTGFTDNLMIPQWTLFSWQ